LQKSTRNHSFDLPLRNGSNSRDALPGIAVVHCTVLHSEARENVRVLNTFAA